MSTLAIHIAEQARRITDGAYLNSADRVRAFAGYFVSRTAHLVDSGGTLTPEEMGVLSTCLSWLADGGSEPEALRPFRRPTIAEAARAYALRSTPEVSP